MQTQNYVELETDLVKVEQLDEDDLIWLSQFLLNKICYCIFLYW